MLLLLCITILVAGAIFLALRPRLAKSLQLRDAKRRLQRQLLDEFTFAKNRLAPLVSQKAANDVEARKNLALAETTFAGVNGLALESEKRARLKQAVVYLEVAHARAAQINIEQAAPEFGRVKLDNQYVTARIRGGLESGLILSEDAGTVLEAFDALLHADLDKLHAVVQRYDGQKDAPGLTAFLQTLHEVINRADSWFDAEHGVMMIYGIKVTPGPTVSHANHEDKYTLEIYTSAGQKPRCFHTTAYDRQRVGLDKLNTGYVDPVPILQEFVKEYCRSMGNAK